MCTQVYAALFSSKWAPPTRCWLSNWYEQSSLRIELQLRIFVQTLYASLSPASFHHTLLKVSSCLFSLTHNGCVHECKLLLCGIYFLEAATWDHFDAVQRGTIYALLISKIEKNSHVIRTCWGTACAGVFTLTHYILLFVPSRPTTHFLKFHFVFLLCPTAYMCESASCSGTVVNSLEPAARPICCHHCGTIDALLIFKIDMSGRHYVLSCSLIVCPHAILVSFSRHAPLTSQKVRLFSLWVHECKLVLYGSQFLEFAARDQFAVLGTDVECAADFPIDVKSRYLVSSCALCHVPSQWHGFRLHQRPTIHFQSFTSFVFFDP